MRIFFTILGLLVPFYIGLGTFTYLDHGSCYSYLSFIITFFLVLFLILNFKFPKVSGIGIIVTCIFYLIILYYFDVHEIEYMFHKLTYLFIYVGFFIFLIFGNFNKIYGRRKLRDEELLLALKSGGKLVRYEFAFSTILLTYKKLSPVYFVASGKKSYVSILWIFVSLVFGWWGFPWGPVYTVQVIYNNINGGTKV